MTSYFDKYGDSSGGSLNDICEKYRIATRKNSIAVIALQSKHKILSESELLQEIDRHYHEDCECGMKGMATIEMMAKKLFEAQDTSWSKEFLRQKKETKWDYDTCLRWMKNLMGKNSFRGKHMEDCAIEELKKHIWKFDIVKSDEKTDVESAVDILVKKDGEIIAGIQVKPSTFYHMGILYVAELNRKLEYPVVDLIYNKAGEFTNFLSVVSNWI
mgnify:CR=1 FL=1